MAKGKRMSAVPTCRDGAKSAVVGYGGAFGMGKAHADWLTKDAGFPTVAVCDIEPARLEEAKQQIPGVQTFTSLDEMLEKSEAKVVAVVTPHNTHAGIAIKCLEAGRHVIVEKPMCITVAEATAMIEAAKKNKVMLTVFHNRRWDGDYLTVKEIVGEGLVGDIFHIEMFGGGYGHPGRWWRANKDISGGAFYDWGAHFVDWLLGLVPSKPKSVTGFFHKLVWRDVTNEDHVQGIVLFENGAVGDVQLSHLAAAGKPKWEILGTKGAILQNHGEDFLHLFTQVNGYASEARVRHKKNDWPAFYQNVGAHLTKGEELIVKPEEARRVIAVMETAEKSAKSGKTEPFPVD